MLTVKDLGKAYKLNNPGKYDDFPDEEVGRGVKRRYPGKYEEYVEVGLSISEPQQMEYPHILETVDQNIELKIQHLWDSHDSGMGRIIAAWRRWKVEGQNKFIEQANNQEHHLIEQASIISEEVARQKKSVEEFKLFLATNNYQITQTRVAGSS